MTVQEEKKDGKDNKEGDKKKPAVPAWSTFVPPNAPAASTAPRPLPQPGAAPPSLPALQYAMMGTAVPPPPPPNGAQFVSRFWDTGQAMLMFQLRPLPKPQPY
jgi:hypothetical protein